MLMAYTTLKCKNEHSERLYYTIGAYVFCENHPGSPHQVCDSLQSRGDTLMVREDITDEQLHKLIRKHRRKELALERNS